MAPPAFTSIGSTAKDVFCNGYNYGAIKVSARTKSKNGTQFIGKTSTDLVSMNVEGNVESSCKINSGINLTGRVSVDNKVYASTTFKDPFVPTGGKVVLNSSFNPATGQTTADIKTSYEQDYVHATCNSKLSFSAPTLLLSIVVGYKNYLAGYQGSVDNKSIQVTKNNFVLEYQNGDTIVTANFKDSCKLGVSFCQKLNKSTNVAAQIAWDKGNIEGGTRLGLAAICNVNKATKIGCKLNNHAQVGITATQKISSGLSLTLSTLIEAAKYSDGDHKVGLGLDFSF